MPPSTRPRGRPREFEEDEVLDRVLQLFWEKGYEATALADIVEASGLNKSSLYNAFGSKDRLYALALDRYLELRQSVITDVLTDGQHGLDDLRNFLDLVRAETDAEVGRLGCLAVNTGTEFGSTDPDMVEASTRFRDTMRTALRATLRRAAAAGEIEAGTVERDVAVLLAFMLSLSVIARSGASPEEIDAQFQGIEAQIDAWRFA